MAQSMIVRRFLLWARSASPGCRAEAVSALARAYLYSDLSADDLWEAETAMTAMLDDPSPLVRRALAEAFANATEAPRHLVIALAGDQSDIAALVLSRSPVLTDSDLVDSAAMSDELAQAAIARRPVLSVAVAAALAEIAPVPALVALVENSGATIARPSLFRMVERHGSDPTLREALLQRPDLPLDLRQAIAASLSSALSAFVVGCGWLSPERSERVAREAQDKTAIVLTHSGGRADVTRLVRLLRANGQLTPALMLRALLSGGVAFVEAALVDLTGMKPARVAGFMRDGAGAGFAALYGRARLPQSLKPAFSAALLAWRESGRPDAPAQFGQLSRPMIARVLAACAEMPPEEGGKLTALLHRFEVEAAREEAREVAQALADEAALAAVIQAVPTVRLEDFSEERWASAA